MHTAAGRRGEKLIRICFDFCLRISTHVRKFELRSWWHWTNLQYRIGSLLGIHPPIDGSEIHFDRPAYEPCNGVTTYVGKQLCNAAWWRCPLGALCRGTTVDERTSGLLRFSVLKSACWKEQIWNQQVVLLGRTCSTKLICKKLSILNRKTQSQSKP